MFVVLTQRIRGKRHNWKKIKETSPASLKNDVWNAWKIIKNKHLQEA